MTANRLLLGILAASAVGVTLAAQAPAARTGAPAAAMKAVPAHAPAGLPVAEQTAMVKQYCAGCHSERGKAGGLSLAAFDAAAVVENAGITEKMIRKLRTGMMPPSGARRPEEAQIAALADAFETRIDKAAALQPNPGSRPSQRLNRAEYALAVRDLLAVEVDVTAFLPPDTISQGFDNVADVQTFSATLMEGYMRAASRISRLAVGDRNATPSATTYKVPRTQSQMHQIDGAPLGTRGGTSVVHTFPADGAYVFTLTLHGSPTGELFGAPARGEQIEVSIDGDRVALVDISPRMTEQDKNGLNMFTGRVHVNAGPRRVSAAFLQRFDGPIDDLLAPIEHTLADTNIGETFGITALPHLRDFVITGPYDATGVSATPSRQRIFTCRPTTASEETPCATEILMRLAAHAYRGPVTPDDFKGLMSFYEAARKKGDFEAGIRSAVQVILMSPRFLIRLETTPSLLRVGQTYQVSELDLASRLSFFLWGSVPDAELLKLAAQRVLRQPAVLDTQVRRMLADARSSALATRFASQWLRLQDVEKVRPDHHFFPMWDYALSQGFVRETELLFDSIVRDDRSVLDLLTADYTFVNERLAKHYGIPNVMGSDFRRVALTDANRRGVLGHGSILMLTSIADRTSPVLRGKWVMEVLLGSPPPPPPPNVPALEDLQAGGAVKQMSVRERMEAHRKNPACTSCHKVIDPLGLALENFDVIGSWRIKDSMVPVDPSGDLYDGTKMNGPVGLRQALLKHQDAILMSFTESLMTYALGRRVETYDMPTVRAIVRDARRSDNKMSAFILGVVRSGAFRTSRVTEAVATDAVASVTNKPPTATVAQH